MKKILLVDDQAHVIRVVKLGLEDGGYEVDTAANGSECLVKLCSAH
ncbi:MAG: DNA-binding response regulator, partial [Woeseiaceae bacterium]|nr:DNA-binding response regulator [Woeseiaceae bacterium]